MLDMNILRKFKTVVTHFAVMLIKDVWSYRRRKMLWPILLNVGVFALSPEEDILFMSMSKRTKTNTPFGAVIKLMIRPLWRLVPCTRSCPTEMISTGMISTAEFCP
jgi:hypothetical protein